MAILLTVMQGNLREIWHMCLQLLPGLIFSGSDIKAKIQPGIEARWCTIEFLLIFDVNLYFALLRGYLHNAI